MSAPPRSWLVAAFASVYVFWGATFLAFRYVVAELPPLLTVGVRCAGGALLLFAWLGFRGRLQRVPAAAWVGSSIAGVLLFLACHGVMVSVEQRVSSGETALVMTAIPLWLVLLEAVRARRFPPLTVVVGLALGAAGVAVLSAGQGRESGRILDHAALLASAFAWALGSLVARHGPRPGSVVQATAMQLSAGAVVLLGLSAMVEPWDGVRLSARGGASLAFLIVCGTTVAMVAYTWLLRVATPAAAGTYAFVNPVIALLLGWAVGDDTLGWRTLLAAVLVVAAVLVTQWRGLVGPRRSVGQARVSRRPVVITAPGPPDPELRMNSWLRLS